LGRIAKLGESLESHVTRPRYQGHLGKTVQK
jgi:hypothetical protein